MLIEGKDYELVPILENGVEGWNIRIMEGDYPETVIRFGTLTPDPQNQQIRFTFDIVYSPDDSITKENRGLQEHAAKLLAAIIPTTMES
jgi:hypothetical protein